MKFLPDISSRGIGYAMLRVAVLVYLLFGALLYIRQDSFVFVPPSSLMEYCPELPDAEIVTIVGTRAYFLTSGSSTKLAVMYHGNGESACDSAHFSRFLTMRGWNVLSVEYAGYAGDPVKPSVALLLRDVENVDTWVRAQQYSEVLIVGRSVGSGFASHHALLASPDKLLLISPFDSLARVASDHFPMYPVRYLLKRDLDNVPGASLAKQAFIIHGTADAIVPFERGKSLFDRLPQKEKIFFSAEGHGHNDVLDSPEAWGAIEEFLEGG